MPAAKAPTLLPLTPLYDETQHGVYFAALDHALAHSAERVRNIALSGSYGVGKSSILERVAIRYKTRVIRISLSSLGFAGFSQLKSSGGAEETKTNLIQKEIVKQVLYGELPGKMPGSRYKRNTRFRFWRGLLPAVLAAVPITLLCFLAGWSDKLSGLVTLPTESEPWLNLVHLAVFLLAASVVLGTQYVFHNRLSIAKISAGSAAIELSDQSNTFFDEYLDELVYFFEVANRDVVIFEDIDRFDNAHIFETLRSLNTLLNGAKQLKGRSIRFIYAIKDSIFDELGARAAREELRLAKASEEVSSEVGSLDAAEAELARANRTKFFDLVIPVVPFITHGSARDLLSRTLKDLDHELSADVIDLASRHLPDMRLLKNIRNEFAIFRQQIIEDGSLDLDEDRLFAMVLYKSVHLSDFELIKLGKSNLDLLYEDHRTIVNLGIKACNTTIRSANLTLRTPGLTAKRCKQLGDALDGYIARIFRHIGVQSGARRLASEVIDDTTLRSVDFWKKLAATDAGLSVSYLSPNSPYGQTLSLNLARADIAEALGVNLNETDLVSELRAQAQNQIESALADRDFLSHADFADLVERHEFKMEREGRTPASLLDIVSERLKSDLAVQLVKAGYIGRDFTLYTSTFYGDRVSASAMNFLLKNIDANRIDMYFELSGEEVETIVRERGRSVLRERSAYNISFMNYLLEFDPEGARLVVNELMRYGAVEQQFLFAYMEGGASREALVQALAPSWQEILPFIIAAAPLDDETRIRLLDVTLQSISDEIQYVVDESVLSFLTSNYERLDAFTLATTPPRVANRVATLLAKGAARLPRLALLSPSMQRAVTALGAFVVTRDNLVVALDSESSNLALDSISEENPAVYQRTLEDLLGYLSSLEPDELTIAQATNFTATVHDILKADATMLASVIKRASSSCIVQHLEEVAQEAWPALADTYRFSVSFENVAAYRREFGIDASVAKVLTSAGQIEVQDSDEELPKQELAIAIIGEKTRFPSPELRARLAESLKLETYIPTASIPTESGELIGHLIANEVVVDDAVVFSLLPASDWSGREFAISSSSQFASYMTTTEVPPRDLARVMASPRVPNEVKGSIIRRFEEFAERADPKALESLADYAIQHDKTLTVTNVARLAAGKAGVPLVMQTLQPHLAEIALHDLTPILESLGGEYMKMARRTGKRPRFPDTPSNRALVDRLKELGVVSSRTIVGGGIRAVVRRP